MKEHIADKTFHMGEIRLKGYSKKAMEQVYPGGGYRIYGEIGTKKNIEGAEALERWKKRGISDEIPVYPVNTYGKLYSKAGYVRYKDGSYLLVRKSRLSKILAGVLALAAIVALIVIGILWFLNQPKMEGGAKPYDYTIEKPENWDPTKILVPAYPDWNMKAGTDVVYAALYNPEENPCYFRFTVILEESKETLYQSGLVEPGSAVTEIPLPRQMEEGTYPVVVKIDSYSLKDHKERLNGAEVSTRIVAIEAQE